jgi:hypothetical protein
MSLVHGDLPMEEGISVSARDFFLIFF